MHTADYHHAIINDTDEEVKVITLSDVLFRSGGETEEDGQVRCAFSTTQFHLSDGQFAFPKRDRPHFVTVRVDHTVFEEQHHIALDITCPSASPCSTLPVKFEITNDSCHRN